MTGFTKLDGKWCIRSTDEIAPGTVVVVTTRTGKTRTVVIGEKIKVGTFTNVYSIQGGGSGMAHRCSYCGERGHKRPTCPTRRRNASIGPSVPATDFDFGASDMDDLAGQADIPFEGYGNSPSNPNGVRAESSEVDIEKIDAWSLIEKLIPVNARTLLYGPPGTGKTTAGNFAGNPSEVYNVTLTEETPAAELRGHYVPRGGDFLWQDGPALKAYRNGARLILNEIDKASTDCLIFCYALLDDFTVSAITLPTGETVKPHPEFSVVCTTNGVPEDLPDGLKDRLSVAVYVPTPHPEAVKTLPVDLRGPARKGFGKPESPSFRQWKAFALLRDSIGNEYAAKAVFGARAATVLNTLKIGQKAGI